LIRQHRTKVGDVIRIIRPDRNVRNRVVLYLVGCVVVGNVSLRSRITRLAGVLNRCIGRIVPGLCDQNRLLILLWNRLARQEIDARRADTGETQQ